MAARRRTRKNPGLFAWLRDEISGEADRRAYARRLAHQEMKRKAEAPSTGAAKATKAIPKTRSYEPIRDQPSPRRPTKRYAVRVRDTHRARTKEFQVIRKEDEFRDLADRAERGELTGDALRDFLNRYQVQRKRKA